MREQNHHQEEEDAEEPDHAKHRKPDLVAFIRDADVERHLVGAGRERIPEAEHEQGDEDQQVACGRAEGVKVGEDVDRGGPARWPRREEGKDRLQQGDRAEHGDRPCWRSELLVDL